MRWRFPRRPLWLCSSLTNEYIPAGVAGTLNREIVFPQSNVPHITPEEFERYPIILFLSTMFCEKEIFYTYEQYEEHLNQTKMFAKTLPNYILNQTSAHTFRNLQIYIHEGKWAMVSKNKAPVIHFVIHHPKLREAIKSFIPPLAEKD